MFQYIILWTSGHRLALHSCQRKRLLSTFVVTTYLRGRNIQADVRARLISSMKRHACAYRYSLVWKLAVLRRSCAKKKSTPTTAATGVSVGCKRPQEDTLNTSNSTCFFQDNGEGDHVRETEARPLSEVPTQPSILLPSMGSVCYFGSARRMKDVQDGVCGTSR